MIRCSECRKGSLVPGRTKEHDVGPLFGLERVLLDDAPALICGNCGHVVPRTWTLIKFREEGAIMNYPWVGE